MCSRRRPKYWLNTFGIGFVSCSFRRRRKWNSILKVFQQYLRRPREHFFQNFLGNVFPGTPQVLIKHLRNWIRVMFFSKKAEVEFNSEGVSTVLATSPGTFFSEFSWKCVPGDAPSTDKTPSELNSCYVVFEEGASGIQFRRCFNSTCDIPGNTFFSFFVKKCSRGCPKYYWNTFVIEFWFCGIVTMLKKCSNVVYICTK